MDAGAPWRAGFEPVLPWPVLPDGVRKPHGCRCGCRTVSYRDRPGKSLPLLPYRDNPWWGSTGACRPAWVRHRSGMRQRMGQGPRREASGNPRGGAACSSDAECQAGWHRVGAYSRRGGLSGSRQAGRAGGIGGEPRGQRGGWYAFERCRVCGRGRGRGGPCGRRCACGRGRLCSQTGRDMCRTYGRVDALGGGRSRGWSRRGDRCGRGMPDGSSAL
jgi:hypothetical protein